MPNRRTTLIAIIAGTVLLAIGYAAGSSPTAEPTPSPAAALAPSATPTAEPTASPAPVAPTPIQTQAVVSAPTDTPEPTPASVVIKGTGSKKTKPFDLAYGDYTVVMSGRATMYTNVIVELFEAGTNDSAGLLFNELHKAGSYRYETSAYALEGSYYLDVSADGAWSVAFKPQS